MADVSAHTQWWQTFEVVAGVPVVAGLALQLAVPLSLPGDLTPVLILAGSVLLLCGVALVVMARREMARYGQPTDPGHPTRRIVTSGVFSVSRNPLYLGGLSVLAGLGLALNLPWVLVLLLPALIVCQWLLIVPEERYLAAHFGEEYARYAASVHRWLGHR